ncbi:Rv3235 family protein [Allorhizocola rhizosphaerae]|uniref:Rv3235 family protein n=1 Tax=Allorhizocola rhizosphaerae TaxID=1872709 RepID=UPI000E3EB462|nr:Rv3235 family protein [Allorhizocola rhizosphaerae]
MSAAIAAPPARFKIHRAPLLDPPFDDELAPDIYRPQRHATLPAAPVEPASAESHTAALRFLNLCLELFHGFRSPAQMWPLLHVEHALAVLDELTKTTRHLSELRRRHTDARIHRRGLRACEPRPGVVEVAAVLNDTLRSWAMCYRLERRTTGWHCTHLKTILPPTAMPSPPVARSATPRAGTKLPTTPQRLPRAARAPGATTQRPGAS